MNKLITPIRPKEAVNTILKSLPNKRLRDIIERRFGIRGSAMTLDAIGKLYGITRERVRQIENDALRHLRKPEVTTYLAGIFRDMANHVVSYGGIQQYEEFIRSMGEENELPHIELLVALHPEIKRAPEADEYHARIYVEKDKCANSEKVVREVVEKLHAKKNPVLWNNLAELVSNSYNAVYGVLPTAEIVASHINFSKQIGKNPYGEYGLLQWATIQPKSIRDKAYVVLMKFGKPMHFQQVASAIDQSGFRGKKNAHPQTVHNELIKDTNRFVLVGRGLYALREWGYEPGTIRDVIVGVLKRENRPMSKELIVKAVLERRFVKENTIMLNLQNKQYFNKDNSGGYNLV